MARNAGNLILLIVMVIMVVVIVVIMMAVVVMMDVMVGYVFDMLENCVRVMMMFYVIRYMNDDMFMM